MHPAQSRISGPRNRGERPTTPRTRKISTALWEAYKDIYDSIKASGDCPTAKIFVTFHYERLIGLGAGVGYPGVTQWEVFEKFEDKLDLLVLTTYPEFEYLDPGEIPDDYYTRLLDNLPGSLQGSALAFAEIGWDSSQNMLPGSNNTIAKQAAFIDRFETVIGSLVDAGRIEFVNWVFLHDFQIGLFTVGATMGLRNNDGSHKMIGPDETMMDRFLELKNSLGLPLGVAPIPRFFPNSTSDDWIDFYATVNGTFDLITAQNSWRDSVAESGQIPSAMHDLFAVREEFGLHDAGLLYGINFWSTGQGPDLNMTE